MVTTKSLLKMQHNWSVISRSKEILHANADNLNEMNLLSLTVFPLQYHNPVVVLFFCVW